MDAREQNTSMKERDASCCPYEAQCCFILNNRDAMPELISRIRKRYCTNQISACARVRIYEALGPARVPSLLMPNQHEWARQILADAAAD
jgi:hypothetical protein